ncbi:UDP-3-O-(3-hydroxymyristoyl)glucosamine N-acyltransferase [Actimicrobium sp. CCC2.4]|uniref:UDP-3-O-(3-hydroxymyristoyl)glucosamine N-acyltransferase n=1 Tax=Actimicrobium sp. CCC2.4 TaxID=3048606 RepID=UPI002AC9162D|nr:UDP-3-O-(3-hydroxymyristoyl)glucosamine N-acyltransferase [Actimicrobium sp. CCC2.4]MEB0134529.1 UDP-3-O-(3-hydroxymyristoyl)glucosamine N-acyltransferase [Actimicrobium sp. CCC2.4]WPX33974.1 UDP-3-O-(3-hydroxymyristoyl)glucosamine N-acyltransferase [Actimicrobium sp. CCC2.4]
MPMLLADLVARLGGQLIGEAGLRISGIAPLDHAGQDHITFLTNPKLRASAATTQAAAIILSPADHALLGTEFAGSRIVTDNPYAYFARVAQVFAAGAALPYPAGIHPAACVDPSASIAPSAHVGPHVVIEADVAIGDDVVLEAGCFIGHGARIGAGTRFHARVTFQSRCEIGARGIIHSGAVIGADGFGFANERGAWIKIPQTGRVMIADDVEIGANTCIDRGALADTIIDEGVKLDNQIQIGHNCHIGAHTAMAGCVGVAGSAVIGKYCTFGGAAMVLGHLTIADKVHISSGSMVTRSIHEAGQYTGFYPLAKNADWEKTAVVVRNLGTMREKIRTLEKTVKSLTEKKNE